MTQTRLIFPLLLGACGLALLIGLGIWQMQRLAWKEIIIAEIDRALAAPPVALPVAPDPSLHNYLAVDVEGSLTGERLRVLTSRQGQGPGHRLIAVMETAGRRILVDLGFRPESAAAGGLEMIPHRILGNLHWPDEHDRWFTPDPEEDVWFARDVPAMAEVLGTEPVLVVHRISQPAVASVKAWPVEGSDIRNTHLEYALTWFGLALVWVLMTGLWLRRITRGAAA